MKLSKPLRIIRNLLLFFFISTTVTVVVYSFMPVYVTPLMIIRSVQQVFKGESPAWHHEWVPFDKLSPHLPMAVIASEDNRFATHNGFDFIEIQKAMKENEKRKRKRGASTISQQTAKNVFLWPQSSWIRKGFEVYFTWMIEMFWSKKRIMTVTAAKLTAGQCALIAATLPNPIRFDSAHPSSYILKRQGQILRLMKLVPKFPPEEPTGSKKKKK